MGKRTNEEREFSESIDRLLAGEEVKAGEDMNEDYRTAIKFARKLAESSVGPSPQFKDQLRQRLLQQLAKQEAAARQKEKGNRFWDGLRNLVPRRPVWQYATTMVAVLMLVFAIVLSSTVFAPSPVVVEPVNGDEGPIIGMPEQDLLGLEAIPQEMVISLAEEVVEIELVFQNISSESLTVTSFPPSIEIIRIDDGEVVRNLEAGGVGVEILQSESVTYTLVWDLRDNSGEKVLPGGYSINVNDVTLSKAGEPAEIHQVFGAVAQLFVD